MSTQSQYSAGYYLKGLTSRVNSVVPKALHKHFDCWMEDVELILAPKEYGSGRDIGHLSYKAVLSFERFPFKKCAPEIVLASIMAWVMDCDEHREQFNLPDPTADIEPESEDCVEMVIEVQFREPFMVVEDANGPIEWEGRKWKVAPYEIWVAEHGDIMSGNGPAAPIGRVA